MVNGLLTTSGFPGCGRFSEFGLGLAAGGQ